MKNQRNVNAIANGGKAVKIEFRFRSVQAVRCTDSHRQGVDAGAGDKFARLFRVGIQRIFCINHQIIFHTAQAAKLGFDAGIIAVAQFNHTLD